MPSITPRGTRHGVARHCNTQTQNVLGCVSAAQLQSDSRFRVAAACPATQQMMQYVPSVQTISRLCRALVMTKQPVTITAELMIRESPQDLTIGRIGCALVCLCQLQQPLLSHSNSKRHRAVSCTPSDSAQITRQWASASTPMTEVPCVFPLRNTLLSTQDFEVGRVGCTLVCLCQLQQPLLSHSNSSARQLTRH
jgi:hypothetical protein